MHIRVTYHLSVYGMSNSQAVLYAKEFRDQVQVGLSPVERLLVVTHREEAGGTWAERHVVPDNIFELHELIDKGVIKVNA